MKIFALLILLITFFLPLHSQNDELGLSTAIEKALENNYNLIIATRDVNISSLNNNWGTAGRYPVISFDASSNNSMDLDRNMTNRVSAGLGLSWLLFDGFRVSLTKDQLDLQEDLSEGALAVQIENTIEDIILAWNNILLQKEILDVFRILMTLSSDRYEYEQRRYDLGGSVTYNVLQAKNVYLADKALFLKQEVQVRNSIRNLNFLMGEDAGATWFIQDSLKADTSDYVLSDLQSKMLSNNQSLKNQYVNIQLRQKLTDLQRSELFPSLRLSAGIQDNYNRNKPYGENAMDANTFGPYGNLSLSYDLYNGGNRRRAIEIAQIEEEIADIENQQIIHLLNNELLSLYDNYNLRVELLHVAQEGIESAELNLRIAEEKFRSGAINSFNYRDIQLIYLNAALEKLSALYNLIASHTALTRITGGFLREEE